MIFFIMLIITVLFLRVSLVQSLFGGIGGFLPDTTHVSGYIDIDNRNESGTRSIEAMGEYFEYRHEYEKSMTEESVIYTLAYIVQMILYAVAAYEKIEQRDEMIDKMQEFMKYLHDTKHNVDYIQLPKMIGVMGMDDRKFNYCDETKRYLNQAREDAVGLTAMEEMYINTSPAGAPDGWGFHDAMLIYPLASATAGELMVTTGKRRVEDIKAKRAELVHKAHVNVRGLFTASTVLNYYQQAQSIYAGLADLYISGFNSAGAGLGVSLQRLASSGGSGGGLMVTAGRGVTPGSGFVPGIGQPAGGAGSGGAVAQTGAGNV